MSFNHSWSLPPGCSGPSGTGWGPILLARAGTTIEAEAATDIQATFHSIVQPIIRSRPELWKDEWATFPMFQRVCGVVQSRTFHLQEDNWLTGVSNEGKPGGCTHCKPTQSVAADYCSYKVSI